MTADSGVRAWIEALPPDALLRLAMTACSAVNRDINTSEIARAMREALAALAPEGFCPKCGGWAAWDERTGTCASCGFIRVELLVSRERLREQIANDPDVETDAGPPHPEPRE